MQCYLEDLPLKLKYTWKISRNSSDSKHNFLVCLKVGEHVFKGEIAPNIRYQETPELIRSQFESIVSHLITVKNEQMLQELLDTSHLCNSLRFGIESAFIHYFAFQHNQSVLRYLQQGKPASVLTSYTIPILPPEEIKAFIRTYELTRFHSLKLKVGQEGLLEMLEAISSVYSGKIRVDANEAWQHPEQLIEIFPLLKKYNLEFIEQPFPATLHEEYMYLKKHSPYPIIGDESITHNPDFELLEKCFDGLNMKLMKAGGYRNGLRILQETRKRGLKTMIGCMVETSLGIFSAFNLCNEVNYIDLDGFFLVENEPFKLISEKNGELFFVT